MSTEDTNVEIIPARTWKASVKKHWKFAAFMTTCVVVQTALLVQFRKAGQAAMAEKILVAAMESAQETA